MAFRLVAFGILACPLHTSRHQFLRGITMMLLLVAAGVVGVVAAIFLLLSVDLAPRAFWW